MRERRARKRQVRGGRDALRAVPHQRERVAPCAGGELARQVFARDDDAANRAVRRGADGHGRANQLATTPHLVESLVTHRFPLEDAPEAFRVASDKTTGALRVVLEPNS